MTPVSDRTVSAMQTTERRTYFVEDLATLEAINSPMRLAILYQLVEPATVREVADRLDVPVTRLYYHVNALEEAGVVDVVETRKSGARLQRVYQAVATHFEPGEGLMERAEDHSRVAEAAAGTVLDGARLDAVAGLTEHLRATAEGAETPAGTLGRCVVRLSPEAAAEFADRVAELADELKDREDRDGEEFALSFVFYPLAGAKGRSRR